MANERTSASRSSASRIRASSPASGVYHRRCDRCPACCTSRWSAARTRTRASPGIDARGAASQPGVLAVITGKDLRRRQGAARFRPAGCCPTSRCRRTMRLRSTRVRHVGEIVAAVVAEDRAAADDAAALVRRRLRSAVRPPPRLEGASKPVPSNCTTRPRQRRPSDGASATRPRPTRTSRRRRRPSRSRCATAGSCRTPSSRALASRSTSRATDEFTLWTTTQNPHIHRAHPRGVRPRHPRAQAARHQPRRRRRLRLEDLSVPGRSHRRSTRHGS